jgi:hypothetical protein
MHVIAPVEVDGARAGLSKDALLQHGIMSEDRCRQSEQRVVEQAQGFVISLTTATGRTGPNVSSFMIRIRG